MLRRACCLALLTSAVLAATPYVPLGFNYTEWGPYVGAIPANPVQQIAADSSGALYILSLCSLAGNAPSCLTKLSADGKTVVWQSTLAFTAGGMAVDPNGNVYLSAPGSTAQSAAVEKLSSADGSVVWTTQVSGGRAIAVDATGRVFLANMLCSPSSCGPASVIRLNTAGTIDATFPSPPIPPTALAVDPTGSYIAVLEGYFEPEAPIRYPFALLAPDGTTWVKFNPPLPTVSPAFAVASNGDVVVHGRDASGNRSLQRMDRTGAVVFSIPIPSLASPGLSINGAAPGELALDAAGNAYITGYTGAFGTPVRNSLALCGTTWVGVYAPDGSMLQTTYLPGATSNVSVYGLIAVGSGGAVFVLDQADTAFTPTQTGPFPQFQYGPLVGSTQTGSSALYNLSPNANAQTMPLACVANAANFGTGAVAPGELVALYGNSLGPKQGVQTAATLERPFPTQAGGTEVTFDGTPAPLLWVQDSQVNVAVPWSVAGPTTRICVRYNNEQTNCLTWPVTQFAPGVFTVDGTHAAAVNQDGTINSASNPAPLNSIVSIWATGLGPISPAQPDGSLVGSPLPVNASQAVLGNWCGGSLPFGHPGIFCTFPTTYAGPAPLLIAGTVQFNFMVDGQPTTSFMLAASAGTATSNTFQIYVAGQ